MTIQEVADYLRLSIPTLNKWRSAGGGPIFIKLGGSVRYRESDVVDFVNGVSSYVRETNDDAVKA
ncbi:hypothetical protein SEA_FORZA_191 [Gordonia phage Forza]|uniref:Helix-turn-helix domain-containing protein n=1 Tax=Gordonia phage Forza TaxID=2571247 RepID=A0A650FB25_9CAUD|nr:excisionase and transcriptional regulator [Gordonia phage Forza]QGT55152.1 hypothetical protein SEA_FORZA_191 [Gordonia phage Forza]UXE04300.1 helix-turn-helix DNA binding domain protein [Gordonia phage BlueNGold]